MKYQQTFKKELSFGGEKLLRGRHKIHPYPAMLHPLLVDYLLDRYAHKNDVVFDPFCGSGVTLLQSSVKGYRSFGFDINPLALLIAKVKTQNIVIRELKAEFADLQKKVAKNREIDIPKIRNRDYWFTKDVLSDLGRIRYVIKNNNFKYKDFFLVTFAYVCRHQSLTRKNEFKRYRIEREKISSCANRVLDLFFAHTAEIIEEFEKSDQPKAESHSRRANAEDKIDEIFTYNLIITSPPYGDSRTTVAYGEYSSFGADWIDDLNIYGGIDYNVDKEGLGRRRPLNDKIFNHQALTDTLDKVKEKDAKRANDLLYFFNGYYHALRNIIGNLETAGRACLVVGNRNVKGFQIPMDQITASFLDEMGLSFEAIFIRDILNKVLPAKNSPSNKVGAKATTMLNEYIVVFKKKTI